MKDSAESNVVPMFRDGLISALGMGTTTDPRSYSGYYHRRLSYPEIEQTYRASWVMRRIIDKPAREMVREWRNWQATPDEISALEKAERKLMLRQKIERALQLAGLGGAGMILGIGNDDPTKPLDPTRITKGALRYVRVYHRTRFSVGPIITDPTSDWCDQPSYFQLNTVGGNAVQIHPSRVIVFKGHHVPDMALAAWDDAFWGDSTVSVVMDAVKNVDTAQNGFAALIKDARNRRLSVSKLLELVATAQGEAMLMKRMQALALGESSYSVTLLDGGDAEGKGAEKIEDRQMVWTGIPQIADMYMTAASGSADMPATVLWGKSPDGMNATGESDLAIWEKTIKGRQDLDLRPCMDQFDAVFIPATIGKQADADGIDWEWRPLSVMSEPEMATSFWNFMQGFAILVDSGTVPTIALEKLVQNKMAESAWFPGTEAVFEELPEDERFPSLSAPDGEVDANGDTIDPNAITQPVKKGGDPVSAGGSAPALRRAANDARFMDAAPKTLYIQRKLLNAADFIKWAKAQGFTTTTPADEIHVTVAFSRQAVDWMTIGTDWSSDKDGNLTVPAGGARIVQPLGDKGAVVLLFGSNDLTYRNQNIVDAGASWDFPEYQPHVTITYAAPAGLDLSKVKPYVGPLKFGPELFSEVQDGWEQTVTEE